MVCSKQVEQSGREVRATRSNRRTCAREPRYCNVSTSCLSGRTRGGKKKKKKKSHFVKKKKDEKKKRRKEASYGNFRFFSFVEDSAARRMLEEKLVEICKIRYLFQQKDQSR